MPGEKQKTKQTGGIVLSTKEKDACRKISSLETGFASQRADALLAINEGSTRAKASELTGLKHGQIKYLLTAFRNKRLNMFPDDVLNNPQQQAEADKKAKGEKKAVKAKKEKSKKEKKSGKTKKGKKAKKKKKEKKEKIKAGKSKKGKSKSSKKKSKK
jgi:hypothetical protein